MEIKGQKSEKEIIFRDICKSVFLFEHKASDVLVFFFVFLDFN